MPSTTGRGYPYPLDTDPINVPADLQRLATAVDDQTYWRFTSPTQRDALWPNPPNGAHCWTAGVDSRYPNMGIEWVRQTGTWWPLGNMLYTTKVNNYTIGLDDQWYGVGWDAVHIDVGNRLDAAKSTWTVPHRAILNIVSGCTVYILDTAGNYAIGDFRVAIAVYYHGVAGNVGAFVIGNHWGRMVMHRLHGSAWVNCSAGDQVQIAVLVGGASGFSKIVGIDYGVGFQIDYIGAGMPSAALLDAEDSFAQLSTPEAQARQFESLGLPPITGDLPLLEPMS